jgi:DNA-binding CsgD family transcriptional regulator/predicted small integral membrane protein
VGCVTILLMFPPSASNDSRRVRGLAPLLALSVVVVLVVWGQARTAWLWSNVHNGLLALAFTTVGTYISFQRPRHREGRLFLATGIVEAVIFFGRQIGHATTGPGRDWWGWLGAWPVAVALALTTLSVLCFPDGRLPSMRWRAVTALVVVVAGFCAIVSAIWPVEYASVGLTTTHPIHSTAPGSVSSLWSAIAHPAYATFQVLWVVAVMVRWRGARGHVRYQLACLALAAFGSVAALLVGLAVWHTARPGILAATLVPIAAGWAIVQGQHLAAYSALTWLSRTGVGSKDLPFEFAHSVARAFDAPTATLWIGNDTVHPIGVWPESDDRTALTTIAALRDSPDFHAATVTKDGNTIGAVSVEREQANHLSLQEQRLLNDLVEQASFVIEHIGLADLVTPQRHERHLDGLTPREHDVLALMARGLSNGAICEELHLSIKTIEPVVSSIFTKLGLHHDTTSNRRVLAVVAFLAPDRDSADQSPHPHLRT